MGGRMSPPGHFSAGVGQEPQPPALAPLPLPALHSLSGWYKIPGWSRPPSFECGRKEDGTIVLRYFSERAGLSPLVIGLLRGLAQRFGQTAIVCQTGHRSEVQTYDEFEVTLREQDQSGNN